jgi:threonine synthase
MFNFLYFYFLIFCTKKGFFPEPHTFLAVDLYEETLQKIEISQSLSVANITADLSNSVSWQL